MENGRLVFSCGSSGGGGVILLFLFVLVTSSSASTEQEKDRVLQLPGQSFNVSFAQYAGYVTVNEDSGRALFYWFFEAQEDPDSKPLVLWLNGGPGCSSIAYGLAEEIGPFHVNADGKSLYLNPYSWNQVANILFLDSPVGVGYSYSNTSSDLLSNGDERTAKDSLAFLKNWLKKFPQYEGRDFYITGESYGGHYVPQLAQAIVRYYKQTSEKSINLKGYMVGNALTDDFHDHLGVFQFMWSSGLISDETYKLSNFFCDFESFIHSSPLCDKILDMADKELGNIDPYSIYTPSCTGNGIISRNKALKRLHPVGRLDAKYDPCTEKHSTVYFNLPEVKKALHVNAAVASSKWHTCSGDTDSVIPVTSTRYSIDSLRLPTLTPWHAWYNNGQQMTGIAFWAVTAQQSEPDVKMWPLEIYMKPIEVGGWTQVYKGLTFVTVRGAGHEVPLHKPDLALVLIKSFLADSSMPTLSQIADF